MGYDDLKVIEAKKFLVAVAGGERRNSTIEDAHAVAEVIAAADASAAGGTWQAVPPSRGPPSAASPRPRGGGRRGVRVGGAGVVPGDRGPAMAEPAAGPPRRPTIRDVAERAGVSKSLVSLVMRGEPLVRDDKRRRVQQAAAELGYRTNWAARSLSAVRSGTVGVLAADLRNPWSMDIVEAVGEVLEEAGLSTLLTSAVLPSSAAGQPQLDVGVIGALRDLRVDGLLVVGSVPDRARLAEVVGDQPVVVVGARAEGLARADVVRSDDAAGMELVVDHLVERGHRRIAHLGGAGGGRAPRSGPPATARP